MRLQPGAHTLAGHHACRARALSQGKRQAQVTAHPHAQVEGAVLVPQPTAPLPPGRRGWRRSSRPPLGRLGRATALPPSCRPVGRATLELPRLLAEPLRDQWEAGVRPRCPPSNHTHAQSAPTAHPPDRPSQPQRPIKPTQPDAHVHVGRARASPQPPTHRPSEANHFFIIKYTAEGKNASFGLHVSSSSSSSSW